MDAIVGYIINENSTEFAEAKIIKEKKDSIISEAVLQDFPRNRNRRKYKESRIVEGLGAIHIQEMVAAKSWYGEDGHPLTDDVKRQMRIEKTNSSHKILSWSHNPGINIMGVMQTSHYPNGIAMMKEMREGTKIAYSMRGMSAVKKQANGDIDVDGPVKILTYDSVVFPSHPTAYQTRILSEGGSLFGAEQEKFGSIQEGGELLIPLSESAMVNFLKDTSETVKNALESAEITDSKRIVLFEAFGRILIEDSRSQIVLLLEKELSSSKAYMEHLVSLRG